MFKITEEVLEQIKITPSYQRKYGTLYADVVLSAQNITELIQETKQHLSEVIYLKLNHYEFGEIISAAVAHGWLIDLIETEKNAFVIKFGSYTHLEHYLVESIINEIYNYCEMVDLSEIVDIIDESNVNKRYIYKLTISCLNAVSTYKINSEKNPLNKYIDYLKNKIFQIENYQFDDNSYMYGFIRVHFYNQFNQRNSSYLIDILNDTIDIEIDEVNITNSVEDINDDIDFESLLDDTIDCIRTLLEDHTASINCDYIIP